MGSRKTVVRVGLLVVLSSGCMVGPDYKNPTVATPAAYRGVSVEQAVNPGRRLVRRPEMVGHISG
jgi:hypothetical protein